MSGQVYAKVPDHSCRTILSVKTWKKLWCILRPSPILEDGIFIVLHLSAHGNSSSTQISIPRTSVIVKTESKTRNHCFAIYPTAESDKPLIYMAGNSEKETQHWMMKIRYMLVGKSLPGKRKHNDPFMVSLIDNAFSVCCGFRGLYGFLSADENGFKIVNENVESYNLQFVWNQIESVDLVSNRNPLDNTVNCAITTNRNFSFGSGQIIIYCEQSRRLFKNLCQFSSMSEIKHIKLNKRLSRSEGTLFDMIDMREHDLSQQERDSGSSLSGFPLENNGDRNSLSEDIGLRLSIGENGCTLKGKELSTLLSAGLMISKAKFDKYCNTHEIIESHSKSLMNISISNDGKRCSEVSMTSGVYEEISENSMVRNPVSKSSNIVLDTYESLNDCVSGFTRSERIDAGVPPPLPPRRRNYKLSATDSGIGEESLYSSPIQDFNENKKNRFQSALGAFRKRIKSESHAPKFTMQRPDCDATSLHSDTVILSRKKRLDSNSTPSKTMQLLKKIKTAKNTATPKKLQKDSAKSCEALDVETKFNSMSRYSQSEENIIGADADTPKTRLADYDDFTYVNNPGRDLSPPHPENAKTYPEDIVDLLLTGKARLFEKKLKQKVDEDVYVPMGGARRVPSKSAKKGTEEGNYLMMKSARV